MNIRRISLTICLIVVVGLLVTFSGSAPTKAQKPFKMGLLLAGSANDQGWNSIAYSALKKIETDLGAQTAYVELQEDPASFEKAFRDMASQGYNMILGHGFEFQDSALTVAKDYPDVFFFISSSRIHEGNVIGLNTDSSQPFFLLGVIAAKMGKKAGFVGGMEIPPIQEAYEGFQLGAQYVDPKFPVEVTYIGNFTDAAAAKEAAISMLKDGADMIVPDADVAGLGVYQAVAEANNDKLGTFGAFGDFTDKAPKNVLANYFSNYGQGIINIAKMVKDGTFKPSANIEFGLKDKDVMWVAYNDKAANPVSADLKKLLDDVTAKIASGEIKTLPPQPAATMAATAAATATK